MGVLALTVGAVELVLGVVNLELYGRNTSTPSLVAGVAGLATGLFAVIAGAGLLAAGL